MLISLLLFGSACLSVGIIIGLIGPGIYRSCSRRRRRPFHFHVGSLTKDDPLNEISKESYKDCRSLLQKNIDIMERNETYVVGSIAAVISFGIGQPERSVFVGQALLVPVLATLGALRWWGLRHVIQLSDAYSRELEKNLPVTGWATYYEAHRRGWLGLSRNMVWAILLAGAIAYPAFCLTRESTLVSKPRPTTSVSAKVR